MSQRQKTKQALPPPASEPWHEPFRAWIVEHEFHESIGRERAKRKDDLRLVLKELAQGRNAPFELDGYRVEFVGQAKTYTRPCAACPTRGQSDKRIEQHIKTHRLIATAGMPNAA